MTPARYVARRRARFLSYCKKQVNIPYGAVLETLNGFLVWQNALLCSATSEDAYEYFSRDDDGRGLERGSLVTAIKARLEKRDKDHQARWDKVWGDSLCQRYKRPEHDDHWIWNFDFSNAPVEDLRYIAGLVGAKA